MIVRKYKSEDFDQIKVWGLQWGAEYSKDQFPKTGFIVEGIAAYFLYTTDSTCCWLENLVCNKEVDKALREEALRLITEEIIKEAKKMGFKIAYATTDNRAVAIRAKALGSGIKPNQFLLTKDLTKP